MLTTGPKVRGCPYLFQESLNDSCQKSRYLCIWTVVTPLVPNTFLLQKHLLSVRYWVEKTSCWESGRWGAGCKMTTEFQLPPSAFSIRARALNSVWTNIYRLFSLRLHVFILGQRAEEWGQTNKTRHTNHYVTVEKEMFGLLAMGSEIPWNSVDRNIFHQLPQPVLDCFHWGHPVCQVNLTHSRRSTVVVTLKKKEKKCK